MSVSDSKPEMSTMAAEDAPNKPSVESPPASSLAQVASDDGKPDPECAKNDPDGEPEPPFSVFTPGQKRFIIIMASLSALFSPLTGMIYWPATTEIAIDFKVSISLINVTITTYVIFQGLAPTFVGTIADVHGRRPLYIVCFIIYLIANIALALQNSYAGLVILRCLQSSGSSGTVALASAVVADVVTSAERGSYLAYVTMGALLGPALGPVIGGVLSQFLGWRSVFWFLTIFSGTVFIIMLVVFPETCRRVVGNGSIPAQKWNLSLLTYLSLRKQRKSGDLTSSKQSVDTVKKPPVSLLGSVRIVADKESAVLLLMGGVIFSGFYMVMAALPTQLQQKYAFNPLQVGLCFIPLGIGSITSAVINGRIVDWNFRRHAKKVGMEINKQKQQNLDNFPIERARLEVALPLIYFGSAIVVAYGWVMQSNTSVAGPIVLLFWVGYSLTGGVNIMNTLIVDLNRQSPATATAAMNLVRCLMGAGAVALVVPMLDRMGMGWVCTFVALVWTLVTGLVWVVVNYGPRWRKEKREKIAKREAEEKAAAEEADHDQGVTEK